MLLLAAQRRALKDQRYFANFARVFGSYLQQNQDKIHQTQRGAGSRAAGRRANTAKLIRTARSIKSKVNMRMNNSKQVTEMLSSIFIIILGCESIGFSTSICPHLMIFVRDLAERESK